MKIEAFAEVVASLPHPIALAKIDIEGAEYEILEKTPAEAWNCIKAISLDRAGWRAEVRDRTILVGVATGSLSDRTRCHPGIFRKKKAPIVLL